MNRYLINDLIKWKNSSYRKPLIIEGARQVGKTWVLKEFGRLEYVNTVYINCDHNTILDDLFVDYDTDRIIRNLSAISGQPIKPNETLIIFDEIQEFPLKKRHKTTRLSPPSLRQAQGKRRRYIVFFLNNLLFQFSFFLTYIPSIFT